jgi:phospholipase C
VVSPWARRGYVAKKVYDHTSVLRMIEARWSLPPLTIRDQTANNLADVLDFTRPQLHAPQYNVPAAVGAPCGTPSTGAEDWSGLLTLARSSGWPV